MAGWSPAEMARALTGNGRSLPRADFPAEAKACPTCDDELQAYKSQTRTVETYQEGAFEAREILKRCVRGSACAVVGSTALARLVPPHQRYGYDLVVHVGLSRYLAGEQRDEIRARLERERGISLSAGTVSALCDRFLVGVESLHLARVPNLRAAMKGGWSLHLDATSDKGKGGLFACIDGRRGWVLVAGRVPSENSEHLEPLVKRAVELFGRPVATVRDLGEAGAGAVQFLRDEGVPDLVCHYHFLGAVGHYLFDDAYSRLRDLLRVSKVRTALHALQRELRPYLATPALPGRLGEGAVRPALAALVLWLLNGNGSKDASYPFGLVHRDFALRCREATARADAWLPSPRTEPERLALRHLYAVVGRLDRDDRVAAVLSEIADGWRVFDELRGVLRLADTELRRGDQRAQQVRLPVTEIERLRQIALDVHAHEARLRASVGEAPARGRSSSPEAAVLKYLHRYGARLFGHPAFRDEDGTVVGVVERTNNVAEDFFGAAKQQLRRRVGRANLGRDLQQQPAQAALAANLRHPDYVRVVCGSLDNLPAALASLDAAPADARPLVRDHRDSKTIARIRALIGVAGRSVARRFTSVSTKAGANLTVI